MKKMNTKGQFYLVAAIIIILAVSGIASVKTYAIIKSEPRKIENIGSELKEETMRVVDYGIYSQENLTKVLNNFTGSEFAPYFLKKTEGTNIVFIYGNKDELYSVQYLEQDTGTVFATLGGASPQWSNIVNYVNRTKIIPRDVGTDITLNVLERNFNFTIMDNEMFYFLITQEKDGEVFVERN